jgi:hypothetical protein
MRFKFVKIVMLLLVAACWTLYATPEALAEDTFFTSRCASCHTNDSATCNGCHAHGVWSSSSKSVKNLRATTDQAQYRPGQTVNVTFSGGYRTGWIRAKLYNQSNQEIARITGPTGMGDDRTNSALLRFPVLMSAPAPSTPGFYTWSAAWFGSPYDQNNSNVYPHVEERVSTNQFEVTTPPPVCADVDLDGYQDIACNADVAIGGGDCNDRNRAISPGVAEVAYNGIDDDCNASTRDDDLDGDGFGISSDCDDTDASVNPGAAEVCNDGIDNDCDGLVDSSDSNCVPPPATTLDGRISDLREPDDLYLQRGGSVQRTLSIVMRARGLATETATGTVYLRKNGVLVGNSSVTLRGDRREVRRSFNVTINSADAPACTWQATLELAGDPNLSNNTASDSTRVTIGSYRDDDDERDDD